MGPPNSRWMDFGSGFEVLQMGDDIVIYRGWRGDDAERKAVLVASVSLHSQTTHGLERLTHEFSLKDELDDAWAIRPLDLVREHGQAMLVLEDPGGVPLDQLIGPPMDVGRFLRLAIAATETLASAHGRGLVHKDIKPAHLLVDEASGKVRLTGFGIASCLPREHPVPEPPETIAGTLAYMAPEQTGRMNRSIDSRSDLYALGVTFYQMLTGTLPFSATEPMEWVHCHIARRPVPPTERVSGLPAAISAIVLKCLAKTAEERYQTAAGIAADLRRCQIEWDAGKGIEPFELAAHDVPDVLRVPERLYGREREVETLLATFERVVSSGRPELVLISGYSGIGKSSVVNALHGALVSPCGLFAAGKCDQYQRDTPYSILAQAFHVLISPVLAKGEAELGRWRDALHAALEPNGALMIALVPELKLIIGEQPPVPDLPPQEAEYRFRKAVLRFIRVFAQREHPLVLFLDDLQWLDPATLALLAELTTNPDMHHLLTIGAYRDNEVDAAHPLTRSMETIRHLGGAVREIVLGPLKPDDVKRLVADTVRCTPEAATPLARLVYSKTAGNPFFTIQFLIALGEEKALSFAPSQGRWLWNLARIRAKTYTDNVVGLMVDKLARLPTDTRDALMQFACLGNTVDCKTLALVLGQPSVSAPAPLQAAMRAGLVSRRNSAFAFLHDRIQEAAYSLITEEARAGMHLRIGRLLASHLPPERIGERIFDVVNQLNRGRALVEPAERERTAELNLMAGRRAKASIAYNAALTYFATGLGLLAEDCWDRRPDLIFSLELHLAECEFLTGALAQSERRLSMLATRTLSIMDRATVACLRIDVYVALDLPERAITVGLEFLRPLGIDWPAHPPLAEVLNECALIQRRLADQPIKGLIDLPMVTDPRILAILDVLVRLVPPATRTEANLKPLLICRAVNLSLEHGNSDASCFAYAHVCSVLGPYLGDYQTGIRLGDLGCELVERRGLRRFLARTYFLRGSFLAWTQHVGASCDFLRRAYDAAIQTGDLTHAGFCSSVLVMSLLSAGAPLAEVEREAEHGTRFAEKARLGLVVDTIAAPLALVRTLRGQTEHFGFLFGSQDEERRTEESFAAHPAAAVAECCYWIQKLKARCFLGDYKAAVDAASNAQRQLWSIRTFFEEAEYNYYSALAHAGRCDQVDGDQRQQHLDALAAHQRQLSLWAANCRENFDHRVSLVGAEIARLEGRVLDAEQLYERAIRSAHENGFLHNEALACELAGQFYLELGLQKNASAHLGDARACYAQWGADGKVAQLDRRYPHLATRPLARQTIGSIVRQLDVSALIKASQAISAEIELPRLIQTLMAIILQNAGADRGLLFLPRDKSFEIQAEACARNGTTEFKLRHSPLAETECPEAMVNYVIHTRKSVIVDDGARPGTAWEGSAYMRLRPPRSAMCLPLIRQGELGGVLYLENSQAAYVFTPDRVALLEVLAARAAIALENARLYGDLQAREARIRRLVEANIIGILIWDVEGRILEANDAFLRILGYERDDVSSGHLNWATLTPPEWLDRDERIWLPKLRNTGSLAPFEKEYFRKDGSRVPVLIGVATFTDARDEGVAFVLDLTERKNAERRQQTMVDELNHRVKNTLATVQALASQTLHTAETPERFVADFESRLLALSQTHNLLNESAWEGVGLRDMLQMEFAPHAGGVPDRCVLAGPDIRLGPVVGVTLGLAIHELTTNAVKYGALSVPSGRVRVTWDRDRDGWLHLDWLETGGPPVQPPRRRGFGTRLIERGLALEVGGKVCLDFPTTGLHCTMDISLDRIGMH